MIFLNLSKVNDDESFQFQKEFYYDCEDCQIKNFYGDDAILYAFSEDKELVDKFLKYRDKKKFFLAVKRMDKSDYNFFKSNRIDLFLKETYFAIVDGVIPFVVTVNEEEMYQSMYDTLDSELEEVDDLRQAFIWIYEGMKPRYKKILEKSGILNIIKMLEGMENGEPFYLEPNFQKFLIDYYGFTL